MDVRYSTPEDSFVVPGLAVPMAQAVLPVVCAQPAELPVAVAAPVMLPTTAEEPVPMFGVGAAAVPCRGS